MRPALSVTLKSTAVGLAEGARSFDWALFGATAESWLSTTGVGAVGLALVHVSVAQEAPESRALEARLAREPEPSAERRATTELIYHRPR